MLQPVWESLGQFLIKLSACLSWEVAILLLLLGVYPREMEMCAPKKKIVQECS